MKRKVLFLCTGNSCRSQLAEAIVNARLGEDWEAVSAGTQPAGYVHPLAVRALAEMGILHAGRSKSVDEFRTTPFDLVVTVCDDAAENCPVWLGPGQKTHLGFPDPAKATGTDEEKLAVFRAVRDDIAQKVPVDALCPGLDRLGLELAANPGRIRSTVASPSGSLRPGGLAIYPIDCKGR